MEHKPRTLSSQKRRTPKSSVDISVPRKQSRSNHDETSVRSQSQDINLELDNAEGLLDQRIFNIQNHNSNNTARTEDQINSGERMLIKEFDDDMDAEDIHSQRSRSVHSHRSLSSDGSARKRTIKSNIALAKKQKKIMQDSDGGLLESSHDQSQDKRLKMEMSNEEAGEIFDMLTQLQSSKGYQPKKTWSTEEYKLLMWAINKYCKGIGKAPKHLGKNDWIQIAGFIPGRNDSQCQYRFNQEKKESIKKSSWVKKEDEELIKVIRENGTKHWNQVAEMLNENLAELALQNPGGTGKPTVLRNGKQCRERWVNFLNPEIKKDPFSLEEDIYLLSKRLEIGNKWAEIIKQMPGRTENNVKNRFNMMFKNIKDEVIKNRIHNSINDCDQDKQMEQIDDKKYIEQLVARKKKSLQEQREQIEGQNQLQQLPKKDSNIENQIDNFFESQGSNMMMEHDQSESKEYLKMNRICSNKEKINHAFQLLIDSCQLQQQNIIKRICKYIQEDINTVIRFSEQVYETFVKNTESNQELIQKIKNSSKMFGQNGVMPMEALFNEMNHATKAVGGEEKKGLKEEAKRENSTIGLARSNLDRASAIFGNTGEQSRGEKKFIEINTNEQLIISSIGAFAAPRDSDKFMPLSNFQQLLYAPFEQQTCSLSTLSKPRASSAGVPSQVQPSNVATTKNQLFLQKPDPKENQVNQYFSKDSNLSSNYQMQDLQASNPNRYSKSCSSISRESNNPNRVSMSYQPIPLQGQIIQQPNGQLYLVPHVIKPFGDPNQGGNASLTQQASQGHQAQAPMQAVNQAMPVQLPMYQIMQNPMSLINYQQQPQHTTPAGANVASPGQVPNLNRMQQVQNPFSNQAARHQYQSQATGAGQAARSLDEMKLRDGPQGFSTGNKKLAMNNVSSQNALHLLYKSQQPATGTPLQLLADQNASKNMSFRMIGGGTPEVMPNQRGTMIQQTIDIQSMHSKSQTPSQALAAELQNGQTKQGFTPVVKKNYNTNQSNNTNMSNPDSNHGQEPPCVSPGGPGVTANHSPIDSAATGGVTHYLNKVSGKTINSQMGGMSGYYHQPPLQVVNQMPLPAMQFPIMQPMFAPQNIQTHPGQMNQNFPRSQHMQQDRDAKR